MMRSLLDISGNQWLLGRIIENILYGYVVFIFFFFITLSNTNNFQKFFFYSEVLWLILVVLLISLELFFDTLVILQNCFLVLVFTALEALIMASILLLNYKKV